MKKAQTFSEWASYYESNPSIDGPPLQPHTISGAEAQIRQLASNIRTTFGLDPQWQKYKHRIVAATDLLDKAADMLDDGSMGGDLRNQPHQYHRPSPEVRQEEL